MFKNMIKKIISTVILIICLVAVAWATFLISKPDSTEMITYDGVRHIAMPLLMSCLFLFLFVRAQTERENKRFFRNVLSFFIGYIFAYANGIYFRLRSMRYCLH